MEAAAGVTISPFHFLAVLSRDPQLHLLSAKSRRQALSLASFAPKPDVNAWSQAALSALRTIVSTVERGGHE